MSETAGVEHGECRQQLGTQLGGLARTERTVVVDDLGEGRSVDVLRHEVRYVGPQVLLDEPRQRRVGHTVEGVDLATQRRHRSGMPDLSGTHDLQHHRAPEPS